MCRHRRADCPADGTNLCQGAGAWAGAAGLVPGGSPSQGTSAARGGGSGVLWVPFVDAKRDVKYQRWNFIVLACVWDWSGPRAGDTCLAQGWDDADQGKDLAAVPGRENSVSFEPVAFPLGMAAEKSTGASGTLLSCQCRPGSTDPQAAQGCTGCWSPGSGERRVPGLLSPPSFRLLQQQAGAFLALSLLPWEHLTPTDLCSSHSPHTQHSVTTPKVTNWLDLAGPISQRKPGRGDLPPRGGCLGQARTPG